MTVHSNRNGLAILRTSRFVSSSSKVGTLLLCRLVPSSSTAQPGVDPLRKNVADANLEAEGKNKPTNFGLDPFEKGWRKPRYI